jgi:hypothetical protein
VAAWDAVGQEEAVEEERPPAPVMETEVELRVSAKPEITG